MTALVRLVAFLVVSLSLAACSSPAPASSSSSKAECFNGAFNIVFAAEAKGDTTCPDLTAKAAQWTYVANSDGTIIGPEPKGTTPKTATADENTCKLNADFSAASPESGCVIANEYFYQLTFDAKGLSGTYRALGCLAVPGDADAGLSPSVEEFDCTYPVTGTKL